MNKTEFLYAIRAHISQLPPQDIQRSLDYYIEMIDDRMEDGMTEEQAVDAMGPVDEIAAQILMDTPLPHLVKAKLRPSRTLRTWEIILLILGSPVWFPLLLAAAVVLLAVYIVIWSVIIVLYAAEITLGTTAIASLLSTFLLIATAKSLQALLFFGAALICAGATVLFFFVCKQTTVALAKLTRAIVRAIKRKFIQGGNAA